MDEHEAALEVERLVEEGFLIEVKPGEYHLSEDADTMHPELAESLRQAQREAAESYVLNLWASGLVEPVGIDEDGEIQWQATERGLEELE